MKLVPCSVMVLVWYAWEGKMLLLKVADPKIVTAVKADVILAEVGLLNVTSTPTLPISVPFPITTTIALADEMLHEEAAAPDEGVEPTFAVHV
jgi:hypothetical protein